MKGLEKSIEGTLLFRDVNFSVEKGDKIVFLSRDPRAMTAFFEIINGNLKADAGTYEWGQTITSAYLPLDNTAFFNTDMNLIEWLSQFSDGQQRALPQRISWQMLFSAMSCSKKHRYFRVARRCVA